MEAVAGEIWELVDIEFDPLPFLQFVRSLSQETYDGAKLRAYEGVPAGHRGNQRRRRISRVVTERKASASL